jgi:hypothetical protein
MKQIMFIILKLATFNFLKITQGIKMKFYQKYTLPTAINLRLTSKLDLKADLWFSNKICSVQKLWIDWSKDLQIFLISFATASLGLIKLFMGITLFIGRKAQHHQTFKNITTFKRMAILSKDGHKFSQELMFSHKPIQFLTINLFKEVFLIVI